ncbi:alpha/beta hydrolase [Kineococcus glutinatus]|uniref:Alpha/beta hydrolase n=1 Tax=Kineococcus glutinatus TaxID=1070872 RepID=A0ABP9HMV9_9ACTN
MGTATTGTSAAVGVVRSPDGSEIVFERVGSGPVLVVVEGATGYRASGAGRGLVPLLAPRCTVVTYDRRGRGDSSDAGPYAVAREVEDLAAVVAAVGGAATLYGVSSGALLAARAAADGVPVNRLALFEPPLPEPANAAADAEFTARISALVAQGRRADALEEFQRAIGVPEEVIAAFAPHRGPAEAVAHTIPYDLAVCLATPEDVLRTVTVHTLVLDSAGTDGTLTGSVARTVAALPRAEHRGLAGRWHQVPDADLAPVLAEFVLRG